MRASWKGSFTVACSVHSLVVVVTKSCTPIRGTSVYASPFLLRFIKLSLHFSNFQFTNRNRGKLRIATWSICGQIRWNRMSHSFFVTQIPRDSFAKSNDSWLVKQSGHLGASCLGKQAIRRKGVADRGAGGQRQRTESVRHT